jgi:hypothetical protein
MYNGRAVYTTAGAWRSDKEQQMLARHRSLVKYVPAFAKEMKAQLISDEKRWGDTWIKRGINFSGQHQSTRFMLWFMDYYDTDQFHIPWVKVACEAMICWVRERIMPL